MSKPSLLRRVFAGIWNTITRIRLALSNILFLVMLGIIYFVYIGPGPEPLPEQAALLLNPMGSIVDEKSPVDPLQALLGEPTPADHEVLLRDVIEAIELARDDDAINSLVLDLGYLMSIGISKTQEIAVALESFSAAGKPIVAVGVATRYAALFSLPIAPVTKRKPPLISLKIDLFSLPVPVFLPRPSDSHLQAS